MKLDSTSTPRIVNDQTMPMRRGARHPERFSQDILTGIMAERALAYIFQRLNLPVARIKENRVDHNPDLSVELSDGSRINIEIQTSQFLFSARDAYAKLYPETLNTEGFHIKLSKVEIAKKRSDQGEPCLLMHLTQYQIFLFDLTQWLGYGPTKMACFPSENKFGFYTPVTSPLVTFFDCGLVKDAWVRVAGEIFREGRVIARLSAVEQDLACGRLTAWLEKTLLG